MKDYDESLYSLFNEQPEQSDNMRLCLEALRRIKSVCDANGVELSVVFGPSFITEMAVFDGPQFWNYYGEVVNIVGDVWDFSDYNDIMLNPYNFYNNLHFFYDVGDLMLATMKSNEAQYESDDTVFGHFGYHVYSDKSECESDSSELAVTVTDYINRREDEYNVLRQEYISTGTVKLKEYDDKSNIVKGSHYFESEELKARDGRQDDIKETYEKTRDQYFENDD